VNPADSVKYIHYETSIVLAVTISAILMLAFVSWQFYVLTASYNFASQS